MADESAPELTSSDITVALSDIEAFAVRFRGIIAVAGKLRQIQSLLGTERERRNLIAELDRQAADVRAVIAKGDAAQVRLDSVESDLARHQATAEAEGKRIVDAAHAAAHDAVEVAHKEAARILAEARATAAAESESQAAAARAHQAEITRLDGEIAARRNEHDGIARAIGELRARIGVS